MSVKVQFVLGLLILILTVVFSYADAAQPNEAIADVFVSDDTDDTYQTRTGIGYHRHIGNGQYFGFHTGNWLVKDPNGRFESNYLTMDHRLVYDKDTYVLGNITFMDSYLMFDYMASHRHNKNWYFEGGVSSSFVDSILAIESNITADHAFVSADYTFNPEWTVSGVLSATSYSDNNDRTQVGVRVIYSFQQYLGWSIQYRGRLTESAFDPIEYFSPEERIQHAILVGYVTGLYHDQLLLRAYVGPGFQTINDDPRESTLEWDISIAGQLNKNWATKVRHLCTSDGGEFDYRYCSVSGSLSYLW